MKITPLEINRQEFKKIMRGYDPVEVDTFLEMLGKEYEKLINSNKEYEKRVLELETELKNFKEVERTLKETLVNVQESSTKSRENSKREADLIRREAELNKAQMVEEAKREVQKLRQEKATLQTQKQSLISRLRHVLTSQMELLEVLELDDEDVAKLKDRTKKVFTGGNKQTAPAADVKGSQSQKNPEPNSKDNNKVDSNIFKDVFGNDVDIEKYAK